MRKICAIGLGLLLFFVSSCSDSDNSKPKNIILFIGDGMGYNHVDVASHFQYGEVGKQIYESFPVKFGMTTHMIGGTEFNPDSANAYLNFIKKKPTDSAASGTALATGSKTTNASLSVDSSKTKLLTILERAELINKSTGVVSTVPFCNATPAAFVAHNESRYNYLEIAKEMILESKVEVIIGGGNPHYNPDGSQVKTINDRVEGSKESYDRTTGDKSQQKIDEELYKYVGGKSVWNLLVSGEAGADSDGDGEKDSWLLIQDRKLFQKYSEGETPKRLLGVFMSGQSTQIERDNSLDTGEPFSSPLNEYVPTLTEMTLVAINVLDNNENGFVLMCEGGAIDWVAHSNLLGKTIEEQIDFNDAVEAACNWVEKNSSWDETLIIVTADHETGYLVGPNSATEEVEKKIIGNGKGKLPSVEWLSTHHTNMLVPFYAKGKGSELFRTAIKGYDEVRGTYIDNSDIGNVISKILTKTVE